jgi:hypothetical protein
MELKAGLEQCGLEQCQCPNVEDEAWFSSTTTFIFGLIIMFLIMHAYYYVMETFFDDYEEDDSSDGESNPADDLDQNGSPQNKSRLMGMGMPGHEPF